jgi:uncharacterized protein YyaL (SSP411 family)
VSRRACTLTRPLRCTAAAPAQASRPANRLAREESPYLLQHAHNPVDWYPWCVSPPRRGHARAEQRPFLYV